MEKVVFSEELKGFVHSVIKRYYSILSLQDYRISLSFNTTEKLAQEQVGFSTSDKIAATNTVSPRYLEACITIYPPIVRMYTSGDKQEVEHIIVHELSHILTQHFFDLAVATYKDEGEMKDAWEMCTERIARIALSVQEEKVRKPTRPKKS